MRCSIPLILALLLSTTVSAAPSAVPGRSGSSASLTLGQDPDLDAELEALLAEERAEAERLRLAGQFKAALRLVGEHLDDDPGDWRSRGIRGRIEADQAEYAQAEADLTAALAAATAAADSASLELGLDLAQLELELGRSRAALARLTALVGSSARRDYLSGEALWQVGDREAARSRFAAPAQRSADGEGWLDFMYRARCERALGQLEAASQSLVTADKLAGGKAAGVLVDLADVYLEADGEVARAGSSARRPDELYKQALDLSPGHAGALIGLYRLHDLNWRRSSRSARSFLVELLDARPHALPGLVALTRDHLKNGEFKGARQRLGELLEVAPGRRDVQALQASLDWLTDRQPEADARFAALAEVAPWDSAPERLCGELLVGLYRFADALPFLERAVERNPGDWQAWTRLGEARSNTGDEPGGLEALRRSKDVAEGRQDAWRNNQSMVLDKMAARWVVSEGPGRLSYALPPDGSQLLARVLAPFYAESREELAARYGYTPGAVRIEVFDRHADFSVRSTGFEGFPALGVCFGPVVTALSPLCEMRGSFSWAETSFHEFSHVIHLGLTHNRCPRWITEGLATWEEEQRDPSWTRNLRRELVDSVAGGAIIPVRELNRAFRGPRIIWAYYQGKLLCDLLIERYGFPAMVELLEAFDRGLELDDALRAAYDLTPEQLDAALLERLDGVVAELHVEPRHDPARARLLKMTLARELPADLAARAEWIDGWCTIAWSAWQDGRRIDAEEALRRLGEAEEGAPRAAFLRGELALAAGDNEAAAAHFDAGFAAGGRDFRASMARASIAGAAGDMQALEANLEAAEADFPGWDEPGLSAELALARFYDQAGDEAAAMDAKQRWLRWNSGDAPMRLEVGQFRLERGAPGDAEAALHLFTGAVEVDPFRSAAHLGRGKALLALGRLDEAREALELAQLVPAELDAEYGAGPIAAGPLGPEQLERSRALIEARRAEIEELLRQTAAGE